MTSRPEHALLEPSASEIDAENRVSASAETPSGEFVVEAVETYNWRRPGRERSELRDMQRVATDVMRRWSAETEDEQAKRRKFLAELQEAAQKNGDVDGANAISAVQALVRQRRQGHA